MFRKNTSNFLYPKKEVRNSFLTASMATGNPQTWYAKKKNEVPVLKAQIISKSQIAFVSNRLITKTKHKTYSVLEYISYFLTTEHTQMRCKTWPFFFFLLALFTLIILLRSCQPATLSKYLFFFFKHFFLQKEILWNA